MLYKASKDFMKSYNETLKPSPSSFLFKINMRHLIFIVKTILDVPNNYATSFENIAWLWVNEVCRTVLDRHTDPLEQEKFFKEANRIASEVFKGVKPTQLPTDWERNYFFYGQPESEHLYNEICEEAKLK